MRHHFRRQHDHAGDVGAVGRRGLKIVDPRMADFVVPITAVIIVMLFAVQRHGTAIVGRFFGPVMVVWFIAIGACGVRGILGHPQILKALSPLYALEFMAEHIHIAFFALAAVVLSVTGAEAPMRTWAISGASRSPSPGCSSCCPRWF